MTIDELFAKCWNDHWDAERFRLSGHSKEVWAKYKNHIGPAFGHMDYLTITRVQVRDFHKTFIKTPVTGNRLLEIMSKLYKFSVEREWNNAAYNPVTGIKHFTEKSRRRYASEDELFRIGKILERMHDEYPLEMTFIWTLMFTGARPRSIERSKWSELSEANGFGILVFDGKSTEATGDMEQVIIPSNIMDMIKKLPKRSDGLIFGIGLPSYLWRKIRKEAGCEDMWCRDFRRSFATIGMSNNVDMKVIGKLLNHHAIGTTEKYALLDNRARVEALTSISDKLNSILKK